MRIALQVVALLAVLGMAVAGFAVVPQPASAADWPDTCLAAETLEPGTHFGSFDRSDRDLMVVDLEDGEYATVRIEFNDVGKTSQLLVFGLNRYIMQMDDRGEKHHFQVDRSQFPNHYYNHSPDVNFSLAGGAEREYRGEDAGKDLLARHFVEAYRLSDGSHEFRIDPAVDRPICLVLTDVGDRGSSSWTLSYEKHTVASAEGTPTAGDGGDSPSALRATITAKNDRIDSLVSTVARKEARIEELENGSGGANGSAVKTVQKTKVVERTQIVYRSGGSNSSSSAQTPGFTALSAVVALLALLVLARRR